jgi:hypothetical protein
MPRLGCAMLLFEWSTVFMDFYHLLVASYGANALITKINGLLLAGFFFYGTSPSSAATFGADIVSVRNYLGTGWAWEVFQLSMYPPQQVLLFYRVVSKPSAALQSKTSPTAYPSQLS